jgi:carbon-monoxide dehydrogenase large subunit
MERLMDLVARELGMEPAQVRRRNLITAAEMPYSVGIPYRDGQPIVYDSGDYPAALDKALEALGGLDAFRRRQREERLKGRHLGLGLGLYTEGTGVGPFEGATVRLEPGGSISVASGACPQGQGMETIYSQITADIWKVKPDDVFVSLADTAVIPMGFGTIGSRSTVNVSSAIYVASERLRKKVFAIAANMLECAPQDLELREGRVAVVGSPGKSVSLADVERASRPGWNHQRPKGVDAGLEETYYWEPPTVTWSYAVHAVIVEVDVPLGHVKLEQYAIAHDCGVVVNPKLADGQVTGGTVQGIGGALFEEYSYDAEGQLHTGSLADYLIPTASDVPSFKLVHLESPSRLTPLGVKGLGEGGAIAPPAAIANAVCDALAPYGVEFNATPIRPEDIFRAVRGAAPSAPRAT